MVSTFGPLKCMSLLQCSLACKLPNSIRRPICKQNLWLLSTEKHCLCSHGLPSLKKSWSTDYHSEFLLESWMDSFCVEVNPPWAYFVSSYNFWSPTKSDKKTLCLVKWKGTMLVTVIPVQWLGKAICLDLLICIWQILTIHLLKEGL